VAAHLPPRFILEAVGLLERGRLARGFGLAVSDTRAERLALVTGLTPSQVRGSLVASFAGSAFRVSSEELDEASARTVLRREWVHLSHSLLCPACLAEEGAWQLHWRLPWSYRLALHAYSYLHLPMVAGIVLFALGLETTLHHLDEALDTVPAVALCGGVALYLLAEIVFLFRTIGRVFRRRTVGAVVLLTLIPAALAIPALAALALVAAVCSLLVAYEAIVRREYRIKLRHSELPG
jgi:Bacterial low temperature requirement A protein (LtrA)/TniQ